jgi:hypothetical protein
MIVSEVKTIMKGIPDNNKNTGKKHELVTLLNTTANKAVYSSMTNSTTK